MKRKSALLDEGVGVPEVPVHSSASGEAGPGMEVDTRQQDLQWLVGWKAVKRNQMKLLFYQSQGLGPAELMSAGVGVVPNNVKPLLVQDQHTNCPIKASEHQAKIQLIQLMLLKTITTVLFIYPQITTQQQPPKGTLHYEVNILR